VGSQDRLNKCLRCGYSRDGLPVDRACPECGLTHDAEVEAWTGRPLVGLVVSQLVWIPVFIICFGGVFSSGSFRIRVVSPSSLIIACLVMAAGALVCYVGTRRSTMLTLPEGLAASMIWSGVKVIPWSDVRWVKPRPRRRQVEVFVRGYGPSNLCGYFRDDADVQRFIDAVQARLAATGQADKKAQESAAQEEGT
jgi:hypothetical protein